MGSPLLGDLAAALDPVAFAERVGMEPDDWQARFLRSSAPRVLLNCCRQSGKSTVSAVAAVHEAVYVPGSLVLLLSPAMRQSSELFQKCKAHYRAIGRPVPTEQESALSLTLENGSRIVSLPGSEATVRGYSAVRLLIVDEAARTDDDLYYAVRPMLAVSGGRLVLLSTPYGKRGFFWDAWSSQEPWERYRVPATECPRISPAFLDEERRVSGSWWVDQEYGCEFLDAATQAFATEDVEGAFVERVEPWAL